MIESLEPPDLRLLERDPLRHIVLLKHLEAYPQHTQVHQVSGQHGQATLVLLDTTGSEYDQRTYPTATHAALISSDHASLTEHLLQFIAHNTGIVFKLSSDADRNVIATQFRLERRTAVLSFTARSGFQPDTRVRVTREPTPAMLELFASQHHAHAWLEPLLHSDQAFTCVLERAGEPLAVCFAFQNYGNIWEVGGVFTQAAQRGQGFAARVVLTALAELERHGRTPRYQVHEENTASIRLAESIGLKRFLTITHFLHTPEEPA